MAIKPLIPDAKIVKESLFSFSSFEVKIVVISLRSFSFTSTNDFLVT